MGYVSLIDGHIDEHENTGYGETTRKFYNIGYEDGVYRFAKYLKEQAFLCDSDTRFSFEAIDADDLDDLVYDFLKDENL